MAEKMIVNGETINLPSRYIMDVTYPNQPRMVVIETGEGAFMLASDVIRMLEGMEKPSDQSR